MMRLYQVLACVGLLALTTCAPPRLEKQPALRQVLYALPDEMPDRYEYRLQGRQVTGVAWLTGSFKGDGSLHLPHRETVELRCRQRADLEHQLLLTAASVKEGSRLLGDRAATIRAANALQATLAGLAQIRTVHLDFEYLAPELAGSYVELVRTLRSAMPKTISLYVTVFPSVSIPARWSAFFLVEQLAQYADGIVVMLYDLHRNGTTAGCVSPISWLDANMAELPKIPPEKIWLGAPLYGYMFKDKKTSALSKRGFEKIAAQETETDGCRVKRTGDGEAYYPARSLYAHYEKLVATRGFAGITYWRAGLEK